MNPAITELSETYFVVKSVIKKMPKAIKVGSVAIARMIPNIQATPLPPLNPAKTG